MKTALELVDRFNEAVNRHRVDDIMSMMTEDCIFESTRPAPDGERFVGQEAVRGFWEAFFERSPKAHFITEEIIEAGDRVITRWRYEWVRDDVSGHIRGADLFKIRDGKIAEKLSYVKG